MVTMNYRVRGGLACSPIVRVWIGRAIQPSQICHNSSFITATKGMMASKRDWTGRLVVRFLGKEIEKDYDQKRKPNTQVDPSSLVEGSGALHFQSCELRINNSVSTIDGENIESQNASSMLRMDVYIFPPSSLPTTCRPIAINLVRECGETVDSCFQRFGLNAEKKLRSVIHADPSPNGKKSKKASQLQVKCVPLFQGGGELIDTTGMSNARFWSMGIHKPLSIRLSIDQMEIPLAVEVNPPTVLGVSTFEKFEGSLFPGVPLHVQVDTLFASNAVVDWYADGKLIHENSPVYVPINDDAGKRLAIMVTPVRPDHNGDGCQEAYQFKRRVESSRPDNTVLGIRPQWQESRDRRSLRIMSFNILADQNAFSGPNRTPFFPWVKDDILTRSRRMPLILYEILAYQADIICLQEVDQIIFDTLLSPVLRHFKYQGYYSVKQTPGNQEGCAMFWSLLKFRRADEEDCKSTKLGHLLGRYETSLEEDLEWKPCEDVITDIFQKRLDLLDTVKNKLGHVVQIAHLQSLDGAPLLVSNTHLFFHPKAPHIRSMQLFAIARQLTKEQGPQCKPFVICGDLNTSLTNCAALFLDRRLPKNHRNYRECFNSFQWEKDSISTTTFDYDFPEMRLPESFPDVGTAYPIYPEFTHYIVNFSATLDHILMTPKTLSGELRFLRQADMPTVEQVTQEVAMPSSTFPSDHIAVVADLDWIPLRH